MDEHNELADRFVAVWNETDPEQHRRCIRDLWIEQGVECTKQRETRGYGALETRIAASHEKNVRDDGYLFRACRNADGHHGLVKFNWEMFKTNDGAIRATGIYVLLLDEAGKIRTAWFFVDP